MDNTNDFLEAVDWISSNPAAASLPNEIKLEIYGLYKFVNTGTSPTSSRPSIFYPAPRAKHDAWAAQAEKHDIDSATNRYIEIAKDLGWNGRDSGSGSSGGLGGGGVKVSTMAIEEKASSSPLHDAVIDGNLATIRRAMRSMAVNEPDEYGLTPLHLAADRGHVEVVRYLLQQGADKDLKDQDGQTPLMLAEAAGRDEIIDILR